MPPSPHGTPVINLKELNEIMDNDMALVQDCFAVFLTDLPDLLVEIQTAIALQQMEKTNEAAHKLKGILKYLAAEPAAQAAMAIESAGKNHDLKELDLKWVALETACKEVKAFITNYHPPGCFKNRGSDENN